MPNLSILQEYLNSLRQERAQVVAGLDRQIQEVEEMVKRHSGNGSTSLGAEAPMLPGFPTTKTKRGRENFAPKYPGTSLAKVLLKTLETGDLDRNQLHQHVLKLGLEYTPRAVDTNLRRL